MEFEYVPLLQIQRDLYSIPRGPERFGAYLKTLLNVSASDTEFFPMVMMNPMGKAHVSARLDALLAMDADAIASQAVASVSAPLEDGSGPFKLGLVVADDAMGGWTNRYTCDFDARFRLEPGLKRRWLSVILWASEEPCARRIREETLMALHRVAYVQRHGAPQTLQEMLEQEGDVMAKAGCRLALEADDLAYTQAVVSPYLSTQEYPTIVACLFGDRAAHSLGYEAQGLSENAGLALALHQARNNVLARE